MNEIEAWCVACAVMQLQLDDAMRSKRTVRHATQLPAWPGFLFLLFVAAWTACAMIVLHMLDSLGLEKSR